MRALSLRRVLSLVLVVAALGALLWSRRWAPVRVAVARVERGPIAREAFGRGTVESQREAALGFDLVGRLSEVLVDEGARVSLGQELARLETNQSQADFRSAQTGIAAARAQLRRLAADEARGRALLATAEREAARAEALFTSGAAAGLHRDEANDRLRLARVELDRLLAQRAEATRGIDVAAGSAEQRRATMVRATLLAPFDGLVTRRLREPGDTVSVGSTVLRLVDTTEVVVRAAVDETVLPMLAEGLPGSIEFPGADRALAGRVTRVGWEADRQTHEVPVELTPERLARRVAIGQRADVRVTLERRPNALRLPIAMIYRDARGPYVYADRGGRIALIRPVFGITGRDAVELRAGLSEGDRVLAATTPGATLPVARRWRAR